MSTPWGSQGPIPPWSMHDAMADMHRQLADANQHMNSALAGAKMEVDRANAAILQAFGPPVVSPPPRVHMALPPPIMTHAGPIPYYGGPTFPAPGWSPPRPTFAAPPHQLPLRAHSPPSPVPAPPQVRKVMPRSVSLPVHPARSMASSSQSPRGQQRSTQDLPSVIVQPHTEAEFDDTRSPTPPPPPYDSWSFVGRRLQAMEDDSRQQPQSSPSSPSEPEARPRRARRRQAAASTQALTFHRYGPPSTVAQTNWDDAMTVTPKSEPGLRAVVPQGHGSPGGYENSDDTPIVLLGASPEEDVFCPPPGRPRKIKRPANWRPDYGSPKILSFLPTVLHHASLFASGNDMPSTRNRSLAGLIHWRNPNNEGMAYDLRSPLTTFDLDRIGVHVATDPPIAWMRLYHHALPWYIDIEDSTSREITVIDVIRQMHDQLMIPLTERDVWNEGVSEETRRCVAQGLHRRTHKGTKGQMLLGGSDPLRLDFLGSDYIFEGLVKGINGMWEIKTRDWRA